MANSEISNGHNYGRALFMSIGCVRHSTILRKRFKLWASSLIQRTFYLAINSKLMRSKFRPSFINYHFIHRWTYAMVFDLKSNFSPFWWFNKSEIRSHSIWQFFVWIRRESNMMDALTRQRFVASRTRFLWISFDATNLCVINTRTIQFFVCSSARSCERWFIASVCMAWEIENKTNGTIYTHTCTNAKSLEKEIFFPKREEKKEKNTHAFLLIFSLLG